MINDFFSDYLMAQTYPGMSAEGNVNEYLTKFLSAGMISISHTPDLKSFETAPLVNIFVL
jgi:hypothetical protein